MTDDREIIGRVAFSDSRPVVGVLARAYAVTLSDEQLLSEDSTDDDGRYRITLGEGPPVNLRVRLFAPDNREITFSSVLFRSSGSVTVDLVVDEDAEGTSEFERYVTAVQPALNDIAMERLGPEGVAYLSGDLEIPADRLEALSDAVRREAEPQPGLPTLPAAVWYGWRRTGFDLDVPAALWERPVADLLAAVRRAVEQRLAPPVRDDGELESAVRAYRLEFLLDRPHAGDSSLRDLLATLPEPLSSDVQRSVAGVLVDEQPPPERLAASLGAAGVHADQAAAVARTLELAEVTGGHAPLVAALQPIDSLAPLRQDEWADLAFRHGTPAGALDPVAYAGGVQAAVEAREPNATLAARLADGTVSLAVPGGDKVQAFLEANPAFDLRSPPAAEEVERLAPERRRDDETLGTAVTALRRLAPVTRTWGDVAALLELGLRSPFDVAGREPEWLATALAGRMPEAEARHLHARAAVVQATTVALVGALRQGANAGAAALPVTTPSPGARAGHPTLEGLFGSLDQCACGQCRSVLGPSAYLVDLLEYLHDGSPQAYAELMARRPDVADVELSCVNTEQEVPAIDLALEILENAVALPMTVSLPPGTDITAILSSPTLPEPVLDVLRLTALDVSGDLRAARGLEDRQLPGSIAWTVADATRRWTLQQTAESLLAALPGAGRPAQSLSTSGLDLAAVLDELDQGRLLDELDGRVRAAATTDPLLQPALEPAGVEVLEPGRRWRVAYDTALEVRAGAPVGGDATLALADGSAVAVERTYSAAAVEATTVALNAGQAGGMVGVLLQEPRAFAVEALAEGVWRLTRERLEVDLAYTPSWLTVMALTYQSDERADAAAAPRNRNPEAYRRLADATFPWSLPFDLPTVETRALLARAGVTRRELAERWASSTATDNLQVALEDLDLSSPEALRIIMPFTPPTLWRAWGLTQQAGDDWFVQDASVDEGVSGPALDVLARVSIVLQQARVSHAELLDLLDTVYVRGTGVAPEIMPVTECRPAAMQLEPVNEALYDRLHRFIRLWRRLGWSIVDADLAVRALGQDGDISGSTLIELAQLERLRGRLGLSVSQLASWWGGIDTRRGRAPVAPLYDRLFGDPGAASFDADFALNAARTALVVEATPAPPVLRDKLAGVAAAFGARADDLAVLLAALPLRSGESQPLPLTLDTVSRLWRAASLARALRLGAADYVQAVRVTGIEPFPVTLAVGASRPRSALEFCAAVQLVRTSGLSLAEVAYVLRHETRPDGSPGLADAAIADVLAGVRSAMAAAAADAGGASAEPAEQLRAALSALGWYPELVDSVVAELPGATSVTLAAGAPVFAELHAALGGLGPVSLDGASLAAADLLADAAWDDLRAALPATASAAARAAWEAALDALADRQAQMRERLERRLLSARLPELSAQTGAAGDAIALPARLRGRCRIEPSDDGAGSRIVVTGWVDPEDGAALEAALGAAHAAAVGELRAASDAYAEQSAAARLLSPAEVTALLSPGADRYPRVLAAVGRHRMIDAAIAQVAQAFALAPELAGDLLLDMLAVPGTLTPAVETLLDPAFADGDPAGRPGAAVFPEAFALMRRLHKVALLAGRLALDRATLRALAGTGPEPARRAAGMLGLDLSALPSGLPATDTPAIFLGFQRTMALTRLRAAAPAGVAAMQAYAVAVLDLDRMADQRQAAALAVLADALDVPADTVTGAAAQVFLFGLTYYDPLGVEAVVALVTALVRLGARPDQVPQLIAFNATAAGAELARSLLRGRYGEATWAEVVRPVSDALRERQRDALVDHLVATRQLDDANTVYEHLLMDVLTGPCLPTTRVLQATATVQLFVNRCLHNLEPVVPAASLNRARWEWMRAYRVWEANRRVFLWPQNWLHPELREDASPAFRRVQSALGQDELTDETAREALLGYLDDLVELSQLAVVGMFQHRRESGGSDLYVVGRTAEPPLRHFWRVCENVDGPDPRWRPWEPVDLDIGGTHVMPFVLDGALHLAWPVLRRLQSGTEVTWELQLASARRTSRGWSQKTISRDVVRTEGLVSKDERGTFTFSLGVEQVLPPASTSAAAPLVISGAEQAAVVTCYAAKELKEKILPRPDSTDGGPGPVQLNLTVRALVSTVVNGQTVYWHAAGTRVTGTLTLTGPSLTVTVVLAIGPGGEATMKIDPSALALSTDVELALFQVMLLTGSVTLEFRYLNVSTTRTLQLATVPGTSRIWKVNVVFPADENTPVPSGLLDPERAVSWQPLGSFVLTASGGTTFEPGRQPQLYRRAWGQVHFENGIREPLGRGGDGFSLGGRPGFLSFESTPGRYDAVPANPREDVPGLQYTATEADVWHYRDGAGQYYIQSPTYGGFRVDADGYPLAAYLRREGARDRRGLYDPATQAIGDGGSLLRDVHNPTPALDPASRTAQGIVFDQRAPYGPYNWELFLHVPLLVAGQLARQQRFEDAEAWLRLVFDPTSTDARAAYPPDPARYWRFLPFRTGPRPDRIEDLLSWLANPTDQHPVQDFVAQIAHWRDNPFRPHEIARMRPGAYEWEVLFAYLDLLLEHGDERFRRDTRESLVEATMLYVQAADLLGPRPRTAEPQLQPPPLTYRALIGRWDEFSNAWYSLADTPLAQALLAYLQWLREHGITGLSGIPDADAAIATLRTAGLTYFCVPANDRLTGYWDRVGDRLFKIRHCQNIDGVERDLPLFEPPIEPDLLVRAVAGGVDIGEAVSGLTAPLLPQRFAVLSARAQALCGEVRSLGQSALSALQSRDAERLAQLRAGHERALAELVEDVRRQQAAEARANVDALLATRESVASRYRHFQYLLTGGAVAAPQRGTPAVEAPSRLSLAPAGVLAADERDLGLVTSESDQLGWQQAAGTYALASGISNGVAAVFFALGTWLAVQPLQGFGHAANAVGSGLGAASTYATNQASRGALIGGYQRRTDDWTFQSNSALRELAQIDRQLTAAELRAAVADNELTNHQQQVAHAREVEGFLRDKYTNEQLYDWMSGELATTYFAAYQLALDVARRAEQALRYELYEPAASFIRPRYWDSLHKGLLVGEQLEQDLRRMEAARFERDRREHELMRRVSLAQVDPLALLELRATGRCTFTLPEMLFDLDVPGHFLRRLKSVALGLPAVAGPNIGAHCRLTLLASTVRHSADPGDAYVRDGDNDPHFTDDRPLAESVVTSGILDDSGVWEPSLRDERRMPFEGRGAISSWRLELPGDFRQFDYESISDVVMTVRYSAREGGERLRAAAVDALTAAVAQAEGTPLALMLSLRHQFPSEWARLVAPQAGARQVTVPIPQDRFPFVLAGRALTVRAVDVFTVPRGSQPPLASPQVSGPPAATPTDLGLQEAAAPAPLRRRHAHGLALAVPADGASASWTVSTTDAVARGLRDVVLVLTYTAAAPSGAAVAPLDALVQPATKEEEELLGRAQVGDAAAAFTLGLRLRDRGDEQADAWLLRGAELGDIAAAYTYGRELWERGDSRAAEPWLRSAAEGGDVAAAGLLGSVLADAGDRAQGQEWLERSAEGGDAFAADRLARLRADG